MNATTRLKTVGTIVDKLKREPGTLRSIQDLAGARVVERMTLDDQDRLASDIAQLCPGAKVVDRRAKPSHGYRAVHVIPRIEGCLVEIQVRTYYQDTWAQFMETLGDTWGRQIRYGLPPHDANAIWSAGAADEPSITRGDVVNAMTTSIPQRIASLEELENRRAQLVNVMTEEELAQLDRQIDEAFGQFRAAWRRLRGLLGLP